MSHGIAFVVLAGLLAADGSELTFQGRVVDDAGKPLAGARVDVDTAAPRVGRGIFCPSCYLDCRKSTTADADGRFLIPIRDASLKFRLLATFPGKKPQLTELVVPEAGDVVLTLGTQPTDWPQDRIVHGRIVNDQNQPIRGAMIEPYGAKTVESRWWGTVKVDSAVSDNNGAFEMLLPDGYQGLDVQVRADGFAGATISLLEPGSQVHKLTIPTGTRVTGRITREGKPVAGLRVAVVQVERTGGHHFIQSVVDPTDEQGRFSFDNLPADEPYVIYSLIDGLNRDYVLSTKRFKAHANHQTRDLGALEVMKSLRMSGQVVLPANKTLPPNARLALGRDPAWDLVAVPVNPDGRFEFVGLPPETYEIRAVVGDFLLDTAKLRYQQTEPTAFGIRIERSVDEIVIPLREPDVKK